MRETTCKYSGMILRAFDRGPRTLFEINLAVLRTMRIFVEDVKGGNLYFTFIDDDCINRRGFCRVAEET